MRSLFPLLFLAAACSSPPGSLQGYGSFSPNGGIALRAVLNDGGIAGYYVKIALADSTPAATCALIDAGLLTTGVLRGEVDLLIAQNPTLQPGTIGITDNNTFQSSDVPSVGFATIELSGPTPTPSQRAELIASSLTGSLTLTKVGDEWAGHFTAMMATVDGGFSSTLSGSFDTSNICETQFQ